MRKDTTTQTTAADKVIAAAEATAAAEMDKARAETEGFFDDAIAQAEPKAVVVETVGPVPLTESDARKLTGEIRNAAKAADKALSKLYALIDEAKAGEAYKALGFKSWTAYLADTLGSEGPLPLVRDDLTKLVRKLAGEGMSSRAIEAATGGAVSQATANRIARRHAIEVPTVGLDGVEQTKAKATRKPRPAAESGKASVAAKWPAPKHNPSHPAVQAVREVITAEAKGKPEPDRVRLAIAAYDDAIAALLAARADLVKAGQKSGEQAA